MTTDKYCDCAQGRWPCTCMPRYDRTAGLIDRNNANAEEFDFMLNGPTIAQLIKDGHLGAYDAKMTRVGYWREQATGLRALLRGKCAEFDALNARLQVYRAVALIGWVGFILTLLEV